MFKVGHFYGPGSQIRDQAMCRIVIRILDPIFGRVTGRDGARQMPAPGPWSNNKGFISVGVVVLMLTLAAVALELSDRSGTRLNTAALDREAIRAELGCRATIEYGLWQLTQNPSWRTAFPGQAYAYAGTTYTLKVLDCTLAGYEDSVMITASAAGATRVTGVGVRLVSNDLIISDTQNHRIRQLDLGTGIIKTIAGNGTAGDGGNGGPATAASLNAPHDACVNSKGEIYIADTLNQTIRKVDSTGIITKVAGTPGIAGYAGDNGPAMTAQLNQPMGVAVDAGDNLYISDTNNHAIRRVDAVTGVITTVVGTGEGGKDGDGGPANLAELKNPNDVAFDTAGNYFIADTESNCIRRVDGVTHTITTVVNTAKKAGSTGDGGLAVNAYLDTPRAVTVAPGNHLFVTDTNAGTIRRVDAATAIITRVAGMTWFNGYNSDGILATWSWLYFPSGVCVTAGNDVIIADTYNSRIRRVDGTTGLIDTIAGTGTAGFSGDNGPGTTARLNYPEEVNPGVPSLKIVPELCR